LVTYQCKDSGENRSWGTNVSLEPAAYISPG